MNEEMIYLTPEYGENDSDAIQKAVSLAAARDIRTVVIPDTKIWRLEKAVRLPSRVTVILDGARLQARGLAFDADGGHGEMNLGTELEEISLLGFHGAVIEGESAASVHFQNLKRFSVAGIHFCGGEGLFLSHCRYGRIQRLRFTQSRYGIRLTEGCNNLLIEDLFAETKQEAVLWQGGDGGVWGRSNEIFDCSLSRVSAKTNGAPAVALKSAVRVANLFLSHLTDRTEGDGVSVALCGTGEKELCDLSLRGLSSLRRTVSLSPHCDGVFLANLRGEAPAIHPNATRILYSEKQEELLPPVFPAEASLDFVFAADPAFRGDSDGETLQNALNAAAGKCLVIPRLHPESSKALWCIDRTLRIPSDTTVVLLDAHLRLKDFTYCNLFAAMESDAKNIRILGVGSATLDSGAFNGLKEKNAHRLGFGSVYDNALLRFSEVTGLKVENLYMIQNRWYCVLCIGCEEGVLRNLELCAHPNYPDMGGIRLHGGCRRLLIENITGLTGEDTILLDAGNPEDPCKEHSRKSLSEIRVRTVMANASRCALVKLRSRSDGSIRRGLLENLLDTSLPEQKKLPIGSVLIGDSESKAISDLVIRDLTGRGEGTVQLGGECKRIRLANVHSYGSSSSALRSLPLPVSCDYKLTGASQALAEEDVPFRVTVEDLNVNGLFFRCTQGSRYMRGTATSIITDKKKYLGCAVELRKTCGEKIVIENVLAERIGQGVFVSGRLSAEIRDFRAEEIGRELALCGEGCNLLLNGKAIPQTKAQRL